MSTFVSAYTVALLPEGNKWRDFAAITVWRLDSGKWAVTRIGHWLSADGRWEQGTQRPADWYATREYDLDEALRLAEQAAPHVRLDRGTVTVAELLAEAGEPRGD